MRPVTEADIRGSFVNCSKGAAQRAGLPRDLDEQPWSELDFLGWRDPGAPERAYLVTERGPDLVGLALHVTAGTRRGFTASGLCSLCLTPRAASDIALMAARRIGPAGRDGNSIGQYMCVDLKCSLYVRGIKQPVGALDLPETLDLDDRIARCRANLDGFLHRLAS
jgi:hypothetical protein